MRRHLVVASVPSCSRQKVERVKAWLVKGRKGEEGEEWKRGRVGGVRSFTCEPG